MSWDEWFLREATRIAERSKDPDKKVGCVIVAPDGKEEVSRGYNGFPKGVEDTAERYADKVFKIAVIRHAEENAISKAKRSLVGCTLYVSPYQPCAHCAGEIIEQGITRVVTDMPDDMDGVSERWKQNFDIAQEIFAEAGVRFECAPKASKVLSFEEEVSLWPDREDRCQFVMINEDGEDPIFCHSIFIDDYEVEHIQVLFSPSDHRFDRSFGTLDAGWDGHGRVQIDRPDNTPKTLGYYTVIWRGDRVAPSDFVAHLEAVMTEWRSRQSTLKDIF